MRKCVSGLLPGAVLCIPVFGQTIGEITGEVKDAAGAGVVGMAGYYREAVPPFLQQCMVSGINIPVQIGKVTVMPGDAVWRQRRSVLYPASFGVEEV